MLAQIRTGLVISRKIAKSDNFTNVRYKVLNLKCVSTEGRIDLDNVEEIEMNERLPYEYLTREKDILIRLSSPYTVVYITGEEQCGYVITSHFEIIRTDEKKVASEYIYWFLRCDSIRQKIIQNISGSTAFGTISSGFFANLDIRVIPLEKQKNLGGYMLLADREQELLSNFINQKELLNKVITDKIYKSIMRGNE